MRIAVLGATGRMGTAVIRLISASSDCTLSGAATEAGHSLTGRDAGESAGTGRLGVMISDSAAAAVADCDVAIDFSAPAAAPATFSACASRKCGLVLGTTGLSNDHLKQLAATARETPIVYGRNMSVGILVFTEIVRLATRLLGPETDIEITEAHHRNKADAPSGTALHLGEVVAGELGVRLDDVAVFDRFSTSGPRRQGSIGFTSVRAGTIVGDHELLFALDEEVIRLQHRALDRTTFARGALRAARWVAGRPAGLYGMADVLGLSQRTEGTATNSGGTST